MSGEIPENGAELMKVLKEISRHLVTNVETTFTRSQGLQFYRDSAFQLCQAYMNGLLFNKDGKFCGVCYLKRLKELEDEAIKLIRTEVENGFYHHRRPSADQAAN